MPDEPKTAEPTPVTTPAASPAQPSPEAQVSAVAAVKEEWRLLRADWEASNARITKLEEGHGAFQGLADSLSPLADAIREFTTAEVAPAKKVHPWKRKIKIF